MFNIHIIAVGKYKESYWKEAEAEYLKRLKQYAKITITELPEESFRDGDDREKIKEKEAQKILARIPNDAHLVALHERGKEMDSVALSSWLATQSSDGTKIVFVIGGPLGLHSSILSHTKTQLSLSSLTFPHQMVRIILLEQLYRSGTIAHKKTYHY